jgi:putative spermidine/putrescine transport system permease protein
VIASILGTLVAFALNRYDFFGRSTINLLVVLPIALPGVVTGVAFSNTYSNFLSPLGINIGYFGLIVSHATFCIVMVFNNLFARLTIEFMPDLRKLFNIPPHHARIHFAAWVL